MRYTSPVTVPTQAHKSESLPTLFITRARPGLAARLRPIRDAACPPASEPIDRAWGDSEWADSERERATRTRRGRGRLGEG